MPDPYSTRGDPSASRRLSRSRRGGFTPARWYSRVWSGTIRRSRPIPALGDCTAAPECRRRPGHSHHLPAPRGPVSLPRPAHLLHRGTGHRSGPVRAAGGLLGPLRAPRPPHAGCDKAWIRSDEPGTGGAGGGWCRADPNPEQERGGNRIRRSEARSDSGHTRSTTQPGLVRRTMIVMVLYSFGSKSCLQFRF